MTDYDPKPTAVHQQESYDNDSGSSVMKWLIPLLVIGAIIAGLFIFFDLDQTKEGNLDIDASLPEFDVEAADIDVDLPEVTLPKIRVEGGDISGGDIDVTLPNEGCEADDISAADCTVARIDDIDVDVDVDADVDADVDMDDPR